MNQLTDTVPISATRLFDVAREVALRLGEWHYSSHFITHIANSQLGTPAIYFTLGYGASDEERREFIDAFALAVGAAVTPHHRASGGWLLAVSFEDDLTGVSVSASVNVGGVS